MTSETLSLFFQQFMDSLADFAIAVISLFPLGQPLPILSNTPTDETFLLIVHTMNWLFPIGFMVSTVQFTIFAITSYFVIAPLARWAKLLT